MQKYDLEVFIPCSCTSEGLYIVKFKKEEEVYLSIFSRGINPKRFNFLDKLRYIWRVITEGKPFEDELVLDKISIEKLKRVLNKI